MSAPLAYLLTWTCHGTWLHGDERGSIDQDHNQIGSPTLAPDSRRLDTAWSRMRGSELLLDEQARGVVERTIREHAQIRAWKVLALHVRTNHVHVVLECADGTPPERAMDQFKAWCTRRLREAGNVGIEQKVWTEHGSTRWINDELGLARAIDYVSRGQGEDIGGVHRDK